MKNISIILFFLSFICLSSCGLTNDSKDKPDLILTEIDSQKTITLQKGDTFEIRLEGNITTGYQWELQKIDSDFFDYPGDYEYQPASDKSLFRKNRVIGGPGYFIFHFEALKSGTTNLDFLYHNNNEESQQFFRNQTFIFEISG